MITVFIRLLNKRVTVLNCRHSGIPRTTPFQPCVLDFSTNSDRKSQPQQSTARSSRLPNLIGMASLLLTYHAEEPRIAKTDDRSTFLLLALPLLHSVWFGYRTHLKSLSCGLELQTSLYRRHNLPRTRLSCYWNTDWSVRIPAVRRRACS